MQFNDRFSINTVVFRALRKQSVQSLPGWIAFCQVHVRFPMASLAAITCTAFPERPTNSAARPSARGFDRKSRQLC